MSVLDNGAKFDQSCTQSNKIVNFSTQELS